MPDKVKEVGEIVWLDLTVAAAEEVREFYASVIGWEAKPLKMGEYNDYVIKTPDQKRTVAGICHARGENANLPPVWLVYIKVPSLEASLAAAQENGGEIVAGPKQFGAARFCVLKDPAGAVFGIIEGEAGAAQ